MSDTHEQPSPSEPKSEATSGIAIFAFLFIGLVAFSLLLPSPYSTLLLVGTLSFSLLFGIFGLRTSIADFPATVASARSSLPSLSIPRSAQAYRNLAAAAFAVVALGSMTAAALDFDPVARGDNGDLLASGAVKMLVGAAVLLVAVRLATHKPALNQPIPEALSLPRHRWWVFAGVGALIMLVLSEINGRFLHIDAMSQVHINVQFAMLFISTMLILYGLGGAPRINLRALRVPREERFTVIAVIAILIFAAFVRFWNQEGTLRVLIDELHWSDGIQRIVGDPFTPILYPMSGQSPYSNVFPYWQAGAVELIGYTWTGFRFVSALCGTLTVLATYGVARALFDRKTALLGMLVMATFPPHIQFSRVAMALIADPLFGTMAVMFIARALRRNNRLEWAAAGVSLGFTQYFYEGGRLLFPALVVGWLIVLAVSGHLRGRWRGVVILLAAFVLVGGPIYYTIVGNQLPAFGRMEVSGDARIGDELSAGITVGDIVERVNHALTAFWFFGAHSDLSVYYGGDQALVNTIMVPLFLFGAFYLLWRFPAPAFLIPLWIIAVGAGNGLLRDTLVSARYYVVMPPLALAIMAGVRYFFPFLAGVVPEQRALRSGESPGATPPISFPWRLAGIATTVLCVVITGYHLWFYYGPQLALFNIQVRDSKPYRDGVDAANRAVDLPGNTQVIIAGEPEHDENVPRHWLTFLSRNHGGDPSRYFPLDSYPTGTISPRFLRDLTPGINYAFFVEPDDENTMRLIYRYLPTAQPPQYSTADIPAHKEYVLIWVPLGG